MSAQKKPKPKKEEITQTLQLPKDLPSAVIGETRRLTFHVTPLSARGLLSAQVRDALKALTRETGGNPVLKIRAFVAGSGDLRRVRDLVSEVFTDRKLPLPALSLIQSGGLPLEGAQVVLEAIAAGKKEVNPLGLVFVSAPVVTSENPLDPVAPLAAQSLDRLKAALKTARSEPSDVVRVTCFLSSLDNLAATRKLVEADYPRAALNYVQTQRSPVARPGRLRSRRAAHLEHRQTRALPARGGRAPGRPGRRAARRAHRHAGQLRLPGSQLAPGLRAPAKGARSPPESPAAMSPSPTTIRWPTRLPRRCASCDPRFSARPPDRCSCSKGSPAWMPALRWTWSP